MRVLYIENNTAFGGSLTGLLELIECLPDTVKPILATQLDVERFVPIPPRATFHHLAIPDHSLSPVGAVRGLWRYYREAVRPWMRALNDLIRENRPDLIHCNNASMSNLPAAFVGRQHQIPVISHQKGFEYSGRLNRIVLRNSPYTFHIGESPAISNHLLALGLSAAKLTTMFDSMRPPENWTPAPEREVPTISMHSMLTAWKGQDVFLRAIGILKRTYAGRFRVIVAGDAPGGDEEFPKKLRQLAVEEEITELVDFRGHVSDVYGLLRDVDIAVHASVSPEPFGRVVAEAMICGVPVLVSDAGGPADYVEQGVTGYRVPMGNAQEMANSLAMLLDNPERRRAMGLAGRAFALEAFDPTRLGKEMVDLYSNILNRQDSFVSKSVREASVSTRMAELKCASK